MDQLGPLGTNNILISNHLPQPMQNAAHMIPAAVHAARCPPLLSAFRLILFLCSPSRNPASRIIWVPEPVTLIYTGGALPQRYLCSRED